MKRRFAALFLMTSSLVACAGQPPPLSRLTTPTPRHTEGSAKVVFAWPPDSCEPGGYQIITTFDGRFIGNVTRGTRLEVDLPPGRWAFMTWNPENERYGAQPRAERVGVLHAELVEGRTYFTRLTFGEWDIYGPRVVYASSAKRGRSRACIDGDATLVTLAPRSDEWMNLRSWLDDLTPIVSDRVAGQQWLDAQPWLVPIHRELAATRELRLSNHARTLSSVLPTDGVVVQP